MFTSAGTAGSTENIRLVSESGKILYRGDVGGAKRFRENMECNELAKHGSLAIMDLQGNRYDSPVKSTAAQVFNKVINWPGKDHPINQLLGFGPGKHLSTGPKITDVGNDLPDILYRGYRSLL